MYSPFRYTVFTDMNIINLTRISETTHFLMRLTDELQTHFSPLDKKKRIKSTVFHNEGTEVSLFEEKIDTFQLSNQFDAIQNLKNYLHREERSFGLRIGCEIKDTWKRKNGWAVI